jgi:hypothetical protein
VERGTLVGDRAHRVEVLTRAVELVVAPMVLG